MAKIDDLQTSFNQLNGAVRDFLATHQERITELEEVRDALLADDSVEDSKLEGLTSAIDSLKSDVDAASGNVPTPVDPSPVDPDTPADPVDPVDPDAPADPADPDAPDASPPVEAPDPNAPPA